MIVLRYDDDLRYVIWQTYNKVENWDVERSLFALAFKDNLNINHTVWYLYVENLACYHKMFLQLGPSKHVCKYRLQVCVCLCVCYRLFKRVAMVGCCTDWTMYILWWKACLTIMHVHVIHDLLFLPISTIEWVNVL